MPELKSNPTLQDFQTYVAELENERGFTIQSLRDKCLLMGEEVGELFRAVRKSEGLAISNDSTFTEVEEELADIFIYLCAIANRLDINLEEAFLAKEVKNKQRSWSQPE